MEKTIHIGTTRDGGLFCSIKLENGNLSISGVVGPMRNGNARGSCGQIIMDDWKFLNYAPGWSAKLVEQFRAVWEEWHLNDMVAGSPDQMAWISANPLDYKYPKSWYSVYSDALRNAGLNPDPNYLHKGKPYKFGSAWLRKEIPADVIAFLESLPETDVMPAWG